VSGGAIRIHNKQSTKIATPCKPKTSKPLTFETFPPKLEEELKKQTQSCQTHYNQQRGLAL
jgi:hypothetical protein